jgi:hypothetical protein
MKISRGGDLCYLLIRFWNTEWPPQKNCKKTCQKLQKPSRLSNPIRSALQRASGQRHRQLCQQPSEGFFNWLPFFLGPESALLLNQTASNCFN